MTIDAWAPDEIASQIEPSGVKKARADALSVLALAIGESKVALDPLAALALGVGCNALVCLAVWLAMGGRSVTDKVLAIIFPITAFVAVSFAHSIANWFFLPWAPRDCWPEPPATCCSSSLAT